MMAEIMSSMVRWAVVAVLAGTVAGCTTKATDGPKDDSAQAKAGEAAVASIEITPEIEAKLVAADAADGAEDHVVSKCASCALHMDGKKEHATKVGSYTLDFCSAECLDGFTKDLKSKLLALQVPEK